MTGKRWKAEVGRAPIVVHIEERAGRPTLWLRWWNRAKNNWSTTPTTIRLRDERDRLIRSAEGEAMAAAEAKRLELASGVSPILTGEHLTVLQGLAEAIHPDTGLYPVDTMHRREVVRELEYVARVLGPAMPWVAIGPQQVQQVWMTRIRELTVRGRSGHRSAEITVSRLLTVAAWLKSLQRIPPGACLAPRKWRVNLRTNWRQIRGETRDPEPHQPRYSEAESLALLAVAPQVDPRLNLLLWLGLELRLGQVQRARRRDVRLDARTFEVHGLGHKHGTLVHLTDGQLAVLTYALTEGYLAPLEAAGGDYPLFPAGQLPGGRKGAGRCAERHRFEPPIGGTARRKWLEKAEQLTGITHVQGRGFYGFKRQAVDQAIQGAKLDPDALQKFGGWQDAQMPMTVYRDRQDDAAERRATRARALVRGEAVTEDVATADEALAGTGGK